MALAVTKLSMKGFSRPLLSGVTLLQLGKDPE